MTDDAWMLPVVVTEHVQQRVAERVGSMDVDAIRGEVRLALLQGRHSDRKPNWARGVPVSGGRKLDLTVFAWDEAARRCWILAIGQCVYVKSVVLERWAASDQAQDLKVRTGMTRT